MFVRKSGRFSIVNALLLAFAILLLAYGLIAAQV
jgi:hypothetical protein